MKRVVMLVYIGLIGGSAMLQSCDKDNPSPNGGGTDSDSTYVGSNSDSTYWGGGSNGQDSTFCGGENNGGGVSDSTNWSGGSPGDTTILGGN